MGEEYAVCALSSRSACMSREHLVHERLLLLATKAVYILSQGILLKSCTAMPEAQARAMTLVQNWLDLVKCAISEVAHFGQGELCHARSTDSMTVSKLHLISPRWLEQM